MRRLLVAVAVAGLLGCSTAALNPGGYRVQLAPTAPSTACKNLGMVIGQGGGTFGGAWISNDKLVEYATNDARNKAAERGANYLQMNAPQLGGGSGTTTTATITGIAYQCPAGVRAPASATQVSTAQ